MKNYERYAEEMRNLKGSYAFCEKFVKPFILKSTNKECEKTDCCYCNLLQTLWLLEEYKEPETDWSNVAVDTPIWVKDEGGEWCKRHFAKYDNGKVYAWGDGYTSWTVKFASSACAAPWDYAKLAEDE